MSDDKKDPPIQEQDFVCGMRVVDIGDYRVARGLSRRASSSCPHHRMVYDKFERRIWCKDCETDVEPFDAFRFLAEHFFWQTEKLNRRQQEIEESEKHSLHLIAAKNIEKAWRGKTMAIPCPHCRGGLLPEDFQRLGGMCSAEFERKRREKK